MTAALPLAPLSPSVRPADRLGFTLLIALALHLVLILGVSFQLPKPSLLSKSLEITLASFDSKKKPKEADYLAQHNQQGSGTLDHKAVPKTTEVAPFQDSKINTVTPPVTPKQSAKQEPAKATLATKTPRPTQTSVKHENTKPLNEPQPAPSFDASQLSSEIASLEAQLDTDRQLYAKRPKIHRLNAASTLRDKGAWYKEEWRKKIERIGNLNYPDEARRQRIYGSLRLMVSINRDGTLYEVQLLESSGQPVLDEAAKRIVRLAAPFAPFSGDLADIDRLEIIRTWRFERGDRLASQ